MRKMRYQFGEIINVRFNQSYVLNSQHRHGRNPNKSQWTIGTAEEIHIFEHSYASNWLSPTARWSWGLHLVDDKPSVVGRSARSSGPIQYLRIAKFVDNSQSWHGYPANYRLNLQDRPDDPILEDWRASGYINKRDMTKIKVGERCSLSD